MWIFHLYNYLHVAHGMDISFLRLFFCAPLAELLHIATLMNLNLEHDISNILYFYYRPFLIAIFLSRAPSMPYRPPPAKTRTAPTNTPEARRLPNK